MGRLTGLLGLATMLGLAYLFSSNRRAIRLKTVALGLVLQFLFAIFVLRFNFGAIPAGVGGPRRRRSFWSIPSPAPSWYLGNWAGRADRWE